MPLITAQIPGNWEELEDLVRSILSECGMDATRQAATALVRGRADIDVLAVETVDGIDQVVACECKYWSTNVPQAVVHGFRTVLADMGANRGYIIARTGFQKGAIEAAQATNIRLVTFEEFQRRYFDRWYRHRLWAVEKSIEGFNTYYEPLGKPGYGQLATDEERTAYDEVWHQYLFVGMILMNFSPYSAMISKALPPGLPLELVPKLEENGIAVPEGFKALGGYREILAYLEILALEGLGALRKVNPITRNLKPDEVTRDD